MTDMDSIISLCKRRGFIYQGSEIYGGLAGTWDYGPLGVALKRNLQNLWWKMFVTDREDMYGVDAAILMNQNVWKASGHVAGFSDPLIECKKCGNPQRADNSIDSVYGENAYAEMVLGFKKQKYEQLFDLIANNKTTVEQRKMLIDQLEKDTSASKRAQTIFNHTKFKCPSCGGTEWLESRQFNMMFKTNIGASEESESVSYLRPETAQGMFVNFKNVVDSFHPKLPFGLAQIGKAFRNEIAPRDFVFRAREFEQMEIEYFTEEKNWEERFAYWMGEMYRWMETIGLSKDAIHELEVPAEDRAHYSKRTVDFEFDFPFGKKELYGIAYRTDFDLNNHATASNTPLYVEDDEQGKIVPHCIEPTFGVDRTVLAVLASAYHEEGEGDDRRVVLKLPTILAPYTACVSPLLKNKPELVSKAREVFTVLKKKFGTITWDDNGNIGKRYRRQDEIGTPWCIVIDFDTLGEHPELLDTVTIRDRDTGEQERVKIAELETYINEKLK